MKKVIATVIMTAPNGAMDGATSEIRYHEHVQDFFAAKFPWVSMFSHISKDSQEVRDKARHPVDGWTEESAGVAVPRGLVWIDALDIYVNGVMPHAEA